MQTPRRRYWIYFWLLTICLFLFPINNGPLRCATGATLIVAFVAAVYWFRKQKPVFFGLILVTVFAVIFYILPGKKVESEKLTTDYLVALRSYEGTQYIWGGENKLGIDCSGLVRSGLIKANFRQGIRTMNPNLVRFSFSLWWHDCSAKALGEGYRGQTRHILSSPSINALDETKILPGDIAVTKSGVHVLAFLGGHEWIEADPEVRRVVIVHTPAANNSWFEEPIQILRWTELESI